MQRIQTMKCAYLILIFFCFRQAFCLDMEHDPAAAALQRGDLKSAYQEILERKESAEIVALFCAESRASAVDPVLKYRFQRVAVAFDRRLHKEMNATNFGEYHRCAADMNLDEPDRIRLITAMIDGMAKLRQAQKDSLRSLLKGMLASGFPPRMKAALLVQASRSASLGVDGKAILPFFRSTDTTIRKAALQALIRGIIRNRDQRLPEANRAIFDSIKGTTSYVPDLYEVFALASIGEDFARDYLLSRCGTDALKLAAIIRHDPYFRHVGIAYAALGFPKNSPLGAALREALRYALKEPEWVARQIAAKPYSDPTKAEELRKTMLLQTTVAR